MTTDEARNRVVLWGGFENHGSASALTNDLWEWDGAHWEQRFANRQPPPGFYGPTTFVTAAQLAWDGASRRTLLFIPAIASANEPSQTWQWDGTDWALLSPAHAPGDAPAVVVGMAWNPKRHRVQLVAGTHLWEWDGTDWTLVLRDLEILNATLLGLVFDENRQCVVAVENTGNVVELLDGGWNRVSVSSFPSGTALSFDKKTNQLELFRSTTTGVEVWRITGSSWYRALTLIAPDRVVAVTREPLRGELLAVTREAFGEPVVRTWVFDGSAWSQQGEESGPDMVGGGGYVVAADDEHRRVMASDYREVQWEWDGLRWTRTPDGPGAISSAAYDPERHEYVGLGLSSTWHRRADAGWARTSATTSAGFQVPWRDALTWDPIRKVVVATFPFSYGNLYGNDFRRPSEWDGTEWAVRPSSEHSDGGETAASLVAWYGTGFIAVSGDVWSTTTWYRDSSDGGDWVMMAGGATPAPREGRHHLMWNPGRSTVWFYAGHPTDGDVLWEWAGSAWSALSIRVPAISPDFQMTWDPATKRMMVLYNSGSWTYVE